MSGFIRKHRVFLLYSLLIIYCFTLILFPGLLPDNVFFSNPNDKFIHFGAYGLLCIIIYLALSFQNKVPLFKKYPAVFALLFSFLFGLADETRQFFVLYRTANIWDLSANFLGSLLAIIIIKIGLKIYYVIRIR